MIGEPGAQVKTDSMGRPNVGHLTPVGIFHDTYLARYGERPDMSAAAKRNLHVALNGYDPDTCRAMVEEYLANREPFFKDQRHPANLFTTWLRQRARRLAPTPTRPVAVARPVEEIEAEFVGTEEEKARAIAWAKDHS
jgi:hypothetical protein